MTSVEIGEGGSEFRDVLQCFAAVTFFRVCTVTARMVRQVSVVLEVVSNHGVGW